MSEQFVGVSKKAFIIGLVAVFVASMLLNYAISSIVIVQPNGDKGDQSSMNADVSGLITVTSFEPSAEFGNKFEVEGFIINFGMETAYNVQVKLTWDQGDGKYINRTITMGNLSSHTIKRVSGTYWFEGEGTFSYKITWTPY